MRQGFKKLGICLVVGVFLGGYSFPALAQPVTLDDLLKRVEAVEKKNADLQQENEALKAQIQTILQSQSAVGTPAAVAAAAVPSPAPKEEIPVTSKLKLSVYGFVQVENVYATGGSVAGGSTAFNNVVEYLAPRVTDNKPQRTDRISAQNSRLGVNITGPDLGQGKTSGQVEMDFNNTPTTSSYTDNYTPRLRQAWAAIDYDQWGIKAGQTWDFFAPLKADLVDASSLWRSGDFGYRHPQVYLTNKWGEVLGGKLTTQVGVIDSDDIYQENSGGPVGGVYASYATRIADRDVTLGAGGILGTESTSALNSEGHNSNDIYAEDVNAQVSITDWLLLKGQGYIGGGLSNFMSGPYGNNLPGTTDTTNLALSKPLKTMGGFAEFTLKPLQKLQINVGAGLDDITNRHSRDFITNLYTAGSDASAMWSTNRSDFINIKYNLTKELIAGIEYQYLRTNYLDGNMATDNRIDTFMTYTF